MVPDSKSGRSVLLERTVVFATRKNCGLGKKTFAATSGTIDIFNLYYIFVFQSKDKDQEL
jgi:hypothetical protein